MKIQAFALFMRQQFKTTERARDYLMRRGRCLELAGFPARGYLYRRAAGYLAQLQG